MSNERNDGLEAAAMIIDRFTNPVVIANKLDWISQPMTFARIMEEIAKEIRSLKKPAEQFRKLGLR